MNHSKKESYESLEKRLLLYITTIASTITVVIAIMGLTYYGSLWIVKRDTAAEKIETATEKLESIPDGFEEWTKSVDDNITELSEKTTELSGKITELSGKTTELSGKIIELSGKIDAFPETFLKYLKDNHYVISLSSGSGRNSGEWPATKVPKPSS